MTQTMLRGSHLALEFLIDGQPAPIYTHAGYRFVESQTGKRFALRVTNLQATRLELVAGVDGRHVLKDEPADPTVCSGLVLEGHRTYTFQGWRIDDLHTDDFVFTAPDASVASQGGHNDRIGAVGVAAFTEQPRMPLAWYREDGLATRGGAAFGTERTSSGVKGLGSGPTHGAGIGDRRVDAVGRTQFIRSGNAPVQTESVYYRSRDWLIANGVILGEELPSPFVTPVPAETGYGSYTHV